jgi:hypothetical protein
MLHYCMTILFFKSSGDQVCTSVDFLLGFVCFTFTTSYDYFCVYIYYYKHATGFVYHFDIWVKISKLQNLSQSSSSCSFVVRPIIDSASKVDLREISRCINLQWSILKDYLPWTQLKAFYIMDHFQFRKLRNKEQIRLDRFSKFLYFIIHLPIFKIRKSSFRTI